MLDFPAVGSKNQQKIPNKPPILNQIRLRNQLQIGLSKPNLRPKFRTGTPYTAGAAAQNVQLQPGSSPKNFHRVNQPPSPEPVTWPAPLPKTLCPPSPTAKPYSRRALQRRALQSSPNKTKTLAKPKPTHSTTRNPRTIPIRTGAIDKNLRP